MSKVNKNIVRVVIGIKLLLLVGMTISIIAIGKQQYTFQVSDIPEHKDLLKEKEGVVLGLITFLIPLLLSLIIDFKELKKEVLKGKWYLLTLSLIVAYVLINQLKMYDYVGILIAVVMTIGLILMLRKQKHLFEK